MKLKYIIFSLIFILCLGGCADVSTAPTKKEISQEKNFNDDTSNFEVVESEVSEDVSEVDELDGIESEKTEPSENEIKNTEPTNLEQINTNINADTVEPKDDAFVRVVDYIPDVIVELRYSTSNNFTGQKIYDFTDAWLRYGTVKKLMLVQDELKQSGLSLKIWDGFRPTSAQFKLWEIYPDSTYVANPNNGFSSHSRGNTVDVTLVYADGTELVMPTGFDDFSIKADRDYSDCGMEEADNALLLEQVMEKYGFKPYYGEWWHYSDSQSYSVEQIFKPSK